jgi:aspartyl-tRNA(Asn)/glutamyl-tRNA(Gln) amidotransferase subunit C
MSITNDEVKKIAHLARLALSNDQTEAFASQLDNIFKLVTVIQNTNTDGIRPMSHPFDAKQRLRKDVVTEGNERELMQKIAPATELGLYLVPQVIE